MSIIARANQIYGKRLDYNNIVDQKGLCFGISMAAISHNLNNNDKEWLIMHAFIVNYGRMDINLDIKKTEKKYISLTKEYKIRHKKDILTTEDYTKIKKGLSNTENKLLKVKGFYEEVLLYMSGASKVHDIFPESTPTIQIHEPVTELLADESWHAFSAIGTRTLLQNENEFINMLRDIANKAKYGKSTFSISFLGHIVTLCLSKNSFFGNKWQVINHDEIYEGRSLSKVYSTLTRGQIDKDNNTIFSIIEYSTAKTDKSSLESVKDDYSQLTTVQKERVLLLAIRENDQDAIDKLLSTGLDINSESYRVQPVIQAAIFGNIYAIEKLLKVPGINPDHCKSAMHQALYSNQAAALDALLQHGVQTTQSNPLLKIALSHRSDAITNILIKNGVNIKAFLFDFLDQKNTKNLAYLLNKGGDANTKIHGMLLLNEAIEEENVLAIKMLLNAGAKFNEEDSIGETPIIKSIKVGNLNIVKLLVISRYMDEPLKISQKNSLNINNIIRETEKRLEKLKLDKNITGITQTSDIINELKTLRKDPEDTMEKWRIELEQEQAKLNAFNDELDTDDSNIEEDRNPIMDNIIPIIITTILLAGALIASIAFPALPTLLYALALLSIYALIHTSYKIISELNNEEIKVAKYLYGSAEPVNAINSQEAQLKEEGNASQKAQSKEEGNDSQEAQLKEEGNASQKAQHNKEPQSPSSGI